MSAVRRDQAGDHTGDEAVAAGRAGHAGGRTAPLILALLLTAGGAALTLAAVGRPWAHAVVALGPFRFEAAPLGRDATGLPAALALVALAGVVAILATRGAGRTIVGALLILAGAGITASVVYAATDRSALEELAARAASLASAAGVRIEITAWPWLTAGGGLLIAAAGLLTVVRGRSWPGMGNRYEAPRRADGGGTGTPSGTAGGMWEALDRGQDPTA